MMQNRISEVVDPAAAEAEGRHWRQRAAELEAEITAAEAAVAQIEAEAAQAALEGAALPSVADAEARVRALTRARALAVERASAADQAAAEVRQQLHAAAAVEIASQRTACAARVDGILGQLNDELAALERLGEHLANHRRAAGARVRRGSPSIRSSDLAGAIQHGAPKLAELLDLARVDHRCRTPLAITLHASTPEGRPQ